MGERKVLNNYISPDFDPSIIPKFKRDKNRIQEIRMMLPFSMQCNTCSEYLYRGKKFNSRKEDCKGEDYMGIRRFRFYIKCSVCSAEITFKTDPKNSDYECESGASRNFEVWRDTEQAVEEADKEREEEDEHDTMKALENRTLDSKLEMDVLDALDEIKAINQRHERVDTNKVLVALQMGGAQNKKATGDGLTATDEELIKSIKFKANSAVSSAPESESTLKSANSSAGNTGNNGDRAEADSVWGGASDVASLLQRQLQKQASTTSVHPAKQPVVVIKKRKVDVLTGAGGENSANKAQAGAVKSGCGSHSSDIKSSETAKPAVAAPTAAPVSAPSMFGDYGDDSD